MVAWVAIAYGALDVSGHPASTDGAQVLVTPTRPAMPSALYAEGARLWRRLVGDGPVEEHLLTTEELEIVHQMEDIGIASADAAHPDRVLAFSEPWLVSPLHELVYALVASVARHKRIAHVFIKGPTLRAQGLRDQEHSGDVDLWVHPDQIGPFVTALDEWGWKPQPDVWADTPVNHSTTLSPPGWGCEIDVHRRMPGLTLEDSAAFDAVVLWKDEVKFAGVTAEVPRRDTNAVLFAMHVMRPEIGEPPTGEAVELAAEALRRSGGAAMDAALRIGAVSALQKPLRSAYPQRWRDIPEGNVMRAWSWRAQPNIAAAYLAALRGVPVRQRPRVILQLVWPAEGIVRASEARAAVTPSNSITGARLRRIGRGVMSALGRSRKRRS